MAITPIAIYFLYYFLSYPDSHLCDPRERSYLTPPEDSETHCIIYNGPECSNNPGFCQKTVENLSYPCLDSSIIAYIPGKCEDLAASQLCTEDDRETKIPDEYSPVCAYTSTNRLGGKKVNSKTWLLGRSSCNSKDTVFHVSGKCEFLESPSICKRNENKPTKMDSLSCAYYTGGDCEEKVCKRTVEEGSTPCEDDSSVMFYVNGACKVPKLDQNEDGSLIPLIKTVLKREGSIIYEVIQEEPVEQEISLPELHEAIEAESSGEETVQSDLGNGLEESPSQVSSSGEEAVPSDLGNELPPSQVLELRIESEDQKGESVQLIGARLLIKEADKVN